MNTTKLDDAATSGQVIRWAHAYDWIVGTFTLGREKAMRAQTLKHAALKPGERVLDIGCGTGTLAIAAAQAHPECDVTGVDPAAAMIERARKKTRAAGVKARFEVGVVEKIDAENDSFDVVLCTLVLHHLPEGMQASALGEIRRVLKPGGRLVLVDFGGSGLFVHDLIARFMGREATASHSVKRVERLLADAGFADSKLHPMSLGYLFCLEAHEPATPTFAS